MEAFKVKITNGIEMLYGPCVCMQCSYRRLYRLPVQSHYYPEIERPEKVEDEVAKFEQGIHHAHLVVLQFVTVGSVAFSGALGTAYVTTLRPLGRGRS